MKSSLFRGLLFNLSCIQRAFCGDIPLNDTFFGKYWRTSPFMFSFAPRSQEW